MHIHTSSLRRLVSAAGLTMLVLGPAADPVFAAPGTISQVPLYVGPNVEPNVVFLNDDSGSMGFTVMTPEDSGYMWVNEGTNRAYYYMFTHPLSDGQRYTEGSRARVVPTEEGLAASSAVSNSASTRRTIAESSGVWRAWNHDYNKVYYNPNITYNPWVGVDRNGNIFGNANPTAARLDPYDPGIGSENLTATKNYTARYIRPQPHSSGTINVSTSNFYPARYYVWSDTNSNNALSGNGLVDASDDRTLIEIKPGGTYTGGAGRSDCAAAPVCTYAEEIQNFANWFSYYRSRDYTAKNAATAAISGVTGIRVGYATINEDSNVRSRVASMNSDPVTGNKRTLFDRIYKSGYQFTSGYAKGTPLRVALHKTGQYYECRSGNIMGASGSNCPILPASQGGMCQKNYTILMTDGFWSDSFSSVGNADGNNNTAWDGGSYGDSYSNTLADVAMHYYERDLAPSLSNDVPSSANSKDNAPHQHMTTFTVAFGVSGTLDPETDDPSASGFSWPDPTSSEAAKIDDLWHAAYNGRGEFFNAQDPDALQAGLAAAFASVARGKSSSASVAFNTTRLGTDSMLYQASFNPSDNWAGSLVATALTIDGQLESTVWDAAARLNARSPSDRLIITYNDATGSGIPFRTLANLSDRQRDDLNTNADGNPDSLGQARLDYLRGDRSNEGPGTDYEFRERSTALGDIVYSNPVFVGRPQSGYEDDPSEGAEEYSHFMSGNIDRPPVIYVGANDGMLHGFWANDGAGYSAGDEAIAYVPNLLFSDERGEGLHYLTEPGYEHQYYVDLSPTVADAFVNGAWRTLLIGGFRAGGSGLFALDVTRPQNFSELAADEIVLWEFDHPDMGYSFSKPTIAQMEDGSWVAIVGNGYNSGGNAKLLVIDLNDGSVLWDKDLGTGTHGLSTPAVADTNGNGKADRVYAGDLAGNLWVFDLSGSNTSQWGSAYKSGNAPRPLFTATVGGAAQPITAKPIMARNPEVSTAGNNQPNIMVYFGTGQYLVNGDKNDVSTQTFYGVWDTGSSDRNRSHLMQQTLTGASSATLRTTTDHAVNFSNQYGWYFDLPAAGERVVVDPKVRGAYVFFNTLIPDAGSCNSQGDGWLMALKLANGGSPDSPVYDVNNDGEVNDGDMLGDESPSGVKLENIPAGSNFLDDVMYTPDDEGNIDVRKIDAGIGDEAGRRSWREVRP